MNKKPSLADKIAGVLSAVPTQFDPDDENLDETRAKLTEIEELQHEIDNDIDYALLSKFRKQNVDLLADVDQRYAGKRGNRKSLKGESSDEEGSDGDGAGNDSEVNSDEDSNDANASDEQPSDSEDVSGEESENENSEASIDLSDTEDTNFQHMTETNVSEQVNKGLCVRNQMNIWESLLEMRIQMQKSLVAANKLPQKSKFKEVLSDTDFKNKVKETKDSLGNVLDKFLDLQNLLIKKYPETKSLGNNSKVEVQVESDEEIPSDTEDEVEEESEQEEHPPPQSSKKRKLDEYEKDISDLHNKYKKYRNETIEKWNTKTRLSTMKTSGPTLSVTSQIEHILSDKEKLRKRTQLKKSEFKILGQKDSSESILESNEDNGDVKQAEEYNSEIFDDSDFYHQLLRELIEVKSADITDPVQLGRQWIQLQNLRSKMKRKIDTRATKGRKIRYAVHTKLVNFTAPNDQQLWTEDAKNELYSSLFGKIKAKPV
ncbi:unnamed protein product [Ceutorhynchus assimilis]|uniref:Protein AATF n=1 Tax=Ceutorhynchus assimilis TaxID=467358 RepID=A0A9N9QMY0_9CUCU|nr:unnamed protein product [Ceutorhynchus assimilis]